MAAKLTIGFLGAGKMATALANGFVRAGILTAERMIASDVSRAARDAFAQQTGAQTTDSNRNVARFAQTLILAVKPDQVSAVLAEIREDLNLTHTLISI